MSAVASRVVGVVPLPQLSALLAASLDKRLTMTDLERRIAVKTLTGGVVGCLHAVYGVPWSESAWMACS